jgi:4-hydroxy-tetrahydrodipicolinate reductase
MTIRVAIAGVTGWAGSALARAVLDAADLELVGAVGRRHAGRTLGDALPGTGSALVIQASVDAALRAPCDVLVEYTMPDAAKGNTLTALARGAHVVIGTSGLDSAAYEEIDAAARRAGRAVLACGNFALTAVLLQRFAELAARYIPDWEITDFADSSKVDAPSGTARELANRLARFRKSDAVTDDPTRGGVFGGSRVHAVRLPGYVLSVDITFGRPGERLSLRHDSGQSAEPYVAGGLLAIRKVGGLTGLVRGLDAVLE